MRIRRIFNFRPEPPAQMAAESISSVIPKPALGFDPARELPVLGLAHVGDAVYELLARSLVCSGAAMPVGQLHKRTVALVRAEAQARAAEVIAPLLTAEEAAVYKRGRNAHVNSSPKHADLGDYHAATGLEALFGWLYLRGRTERVEELFQVIIDN